MSFYISPHGISYARLRSVAREIVRPLDSVEMRPGVGGYLWVGRAPERFAPAIDDATGVTVVTSGRLAWPQTAWSAAAHLPYRGGLANRLILERYLTGGVESVAPYNGSAAIIIHDPRSQCTHSWTDQFGIHPCYVYRRESIERCIFTTFPDALLADADTEVTFDLVTMEEFLRVWRATPPHTYYNEVKHVGAAMHTTVNMLAQSVTNSIYWAPFKRDFFPSINAAAESLSAAVRSAIYERTAIANKTVCFLSGGTDSRILLFGAADRSQVVGAHIYEYETLEKQTAADLCVAAGCQFLELQRDNDYYPRILKDIVRWSGAMWSAEDMHYLGFEDRINNLDADLVMTACSADWIFKNDTLDRRHISMLGRNLPFFKYTNELSKNWHSIAPADPPSLEVQARLDNWFAGCPETLATPLDRLTVADIRMRPVSYTDGISGQIMHRIFPYDSFFADSRIAECYSRIHPDWKLNRAVWGKVAALICADGAKIVDANYGWRVDAGLAEKTVVFARGWLGRRINRRSAVPGNSADTNRAPAAGSWPQLGWYAAHSIILRDLWHSITPEERERMSIVARTDHWSRPIEALRGNGNLLFRLMTLLCHWRECESRRARATNFAVDERLARDSVHLTSA